MGVASCRPRPSRWSGRATRALVVLVDWALDAEPARLTVVAAGSGLNDIGGQRAARGSDSAATRCRACCRVPRPAKSEPGHVLPAAFCARLVPSFRYFVMLFAVFSPPFRVRVASR